MKAIPFLRRFLIAALVVPFASMAAVLDPSFGGDGSVVLPWTNYNSGARVGVLRAPDGGSHVIRSQDGVLRMTRLRADGSVDGNFGSSGTAALDFGGPAGSIDAGAGSTLADGSFLMPAATELLRIGAGGTLLGTLALPRPEGNAGCAGIYPQVIIPGENGELLVYATRWEILTGVRLGCSLVWRLRADLTADTTFGTGGFHSTGFLIDDLKVLPGGGVEMIGTPGGPGSTMVMRLTRAGVADASFGSNGLLLLSDTGNALGKLLPDGGKLVAHKGYGANGEVSAVIRRFRADHSPDPGFGNSGVATVALPASASLHLLFALPDGGHVVLYRWNSRIQLFKLDGRGRLDVKFGSGGSFTYYDSSHEYDDLVGWELQPDGYLVLVLRTESDFAVGGPNYYEAVRLQLVSDLVEFRNSVLDHYFVVYDGSEARGIDEGAAGPGWSRTQQSFRPGGTRAVCRFYGTPGVGPNSHFFTIEPGECERVKHDRGWTYEGLGFHATPVQAPGTCAAGLRAVHRLYNNRWMHNDSNHRYTVAADVVTQMQARGWVHEGVVFCAKP